MKSIYTLLILLGLMAMPVIAQDEKVMIDFEDDSQYTVWRMDKPASYQVTNQFASTGEKGMALHFPKWEEGMPERHYIEIRPTEKDWSGYKYIAFDMTNPTEQDWKFELYITDDREKVDEACHFRIEVPMLSTRQISRDFKFRSEHKVDKKNITRIAFYTKKSNVPIEAVLDSIRLVKKKPDKKDYNKDIAQELRPLRLRAIRENLENVRREARSQNILPQFIQVVDDEAQSILKRAMDPDISYEDLILCLRDSLNVQSSLQRFAQFKDLYTDYRKLGKPLTGYMVGFASSMRKVMPKHLPVKMSIENEVEISLAANEEESFQLAVVPFGESLKDVSVTASDLRGVNGQVIKAENIACDLVAFTQTRDLKSYMKPDDVNYVGWWPDPIIQNPKPVDVALGDVQPWWVRVHVPKGQKPGKYNGQVTVTQNNGTPVSFDLTVEVYDFAMPDHAPFPVMLNTYPDMNKGLLTTEDWKTLKWDWIDFLTDYYMILDDIYRGPSPDRDDALDFEILAYLKKEGKLAPFNLGLFYSGEDKYIDPLQYNYDKVKEMGLLEYAYIYGFDEQPSWAFPDIEKATMKFQKRFPEVFNLTTTNDGQSGNNPAMPHLKGYCPIIAGYNQGASDSARKSLGKYVWWYTCVWPPHPYPNIFLEYPPIDTRTLLGFNATRHEVDGFLYYATMIFGENNNDGINTYPYTNWDSISFINTHGDGRLMYVNDKKQLVPSMVLENYRDGLEDMAYHMILKNQVREFYKQNSGWVRLVRKGNTITAYRSGDGKTWQTYGKHNVEMGGDVYIGLATTSKNSEHAGRTIYDNVDLYAHQASDQWETAAIGINDDDGEVKIDGNQITVTAKGGDIWNRSDKFYFVYRKLSGDGQITAQITDMDDTNEWAKSGVMIRQSLEPNSPYTSMINIPAFEWGLPSRCPTKGSGFQGRSKQNWQSGSWGNKKAEPQWYFDATTALKSTDGVVDGLATYTKDPQVLYAYREKLANLIQRSPIKDTNPWGDRGGIPVRGLWRTWQDDLDGYKSPFRSQK